MHNALYFDVQHILTAELYLLSPW